LLFENSPFRFTVLLSLWSCISSPGHGSPRLPDRTDKLLSIKSFSFCVAPSLQFSSLLITFPLPSLGQGPNLIEGTQLPKHFKVFIYTCRFFKRPNRCQVVSTLCPLFVPIFLEVASNFRRNLTISHPVNCFNTHDPSTQFVPLETFLQLALGLTRIKYQNRFCITNTRNDRIAVNVEMSRKLSLAAIICRYLLWFIGSRRRYTTETSRLFFNQPSQFPTLRSLYSFQTSPNGTPAILFPDTVPRHPGPKEDPWPTVLSVGRSLRCL
jgi:hypothetical protein